MTTPLDPECKLTGLPVSGCAHCRPAAPRPRADKVIAAAFANQCPECGNRIRIADRIGLLEGLWYCDRCVQC